MDGELLLRAVLSLIFVVGIIFGSFAIYKRYFMDKNLLAKGRAKRMKVLEYLYLDRNRKLVIVEKDGVEMTILLGQNSELVIK